MRAFVATLELDLRILYRNGFVVASLVLAVPTIIVLRLLDPAIVAWLMPVVLFENTVINAFFFVGGLLLLEKAEHTLAAHAVTPLGDTRLVLSKVLALTLLSTVEGAAIVLLTLGAAANIVLLILGLAVLAFVFALIGIVVVSRYESINEYLMPSALVATLLSLPLFGYFGVGEAVLYYAHPFQPGMMVLAAAFEPAGPVVTVLAVLVSVLWAVPAFVWALRCYRHRLLAAL